jgi:hypothetical protein
VLSFDFKARAGSQVVDPKVVGASFTVARPIYIRSDILATATLSPNSTSSSYQLYTTNLQTQNNFQFDIVAQIDGIEVKDAGWSSTDISGEPFKCTT